MSEDYMSLQFQWYNKGIKTVKPSGLISLRQLINSIISPKPEMIEAFNSIKKAGQEGNKAEKDRLKSEKLFFTTPSVIFDPIRNYDSIQSFLPFAVFEYDDISHAEDLRDYIFEKRKDCIFAFCSPSFTGCKFIFYTQVAKTVEEYKEYWFGIAFELDKFINLDLSNERCTQPLYNSYDSNAKFREDAIRYSVRGFKENSFVPFTGKVEIPEDINEEGIAECFAMVGHLIDRIVDSGHNQIISTSFISGGLCAYYGINSNEMWAFLEDKIRNNDYLNKGTSGYLKTAQTMYNKGLNFPAPLKKN